MHETHVTLSGNVGSDVTLRRAGESEVASFRLGCTPRRRNRRTEEWFDGPTQWWSVNVWRALGRNCAESLHRGDPVVVHGRVDARTWTNQAGVETTTMEIEAVFVGHDLNRGTTAFVRSQTRPVEATSMVAEPATEQEPEREPEPGSEVESEAASGSLPRASGRLDDDPATREPLAEAA